MFFEVLLLVHFHSCSNGYYKTCQLPDPSSLPASHILASPSYTFPDMASEFHWLLWLLRLLWLPVSLLVCSVSHCIFMELHKWSIYVRKIAKDARDILLKTIKCQVDLGCVHIRQLSCYFHTSDIYVSFCRRRRHFYDHGSGFLGLRWCKTGLSFCMSILLALGQHRHSNHPCIPLDKRIMVFQTWC